MGNITIEIIQDGNIEPCRELCNELMAFQKSKATIEPERFDQMNFDTRMKKSYESALESQVIVVKDDDIPIGYAFSTVEAVEDNKGPSLPQWAKNMKGSSFLPEWNHLPEKYGCINNIYLRNEYRGTGIGSKLFNMSVEWLESFPDVDLIFIYVSNRNDEALKFYLNREFIFSHDVFSGFIKAVYKFKNNTKISI